MPHPAMRSECAEDLNLILVVFITAVAGSKMLGVGRHYAYPLGSYALEKTNPRKLKFPQESHSGKRKKLKPKEGSYA